ncbi:hypothetical protein N7540_006309 [Penicillium herquei]|nr:hypothetical protein N7540_006309 [Penicillium herquei]
MWILPLLGYLGVVVGFAFLTLAIASGLYYLSELVEEHTVFARKLLGRLIYTIIGIQILLVLFDRFPIWLSILSILSHLVYASNLRRFPIVKLSDPLFILSCILVLLNHWLWFRHFSKPPAPSRAADQNWRQPYQFNYEDMPSFSEVASYFGLCVWLVPFALFVSLSAGENVLPSMGSEYATGERSSGLGHSRGPSDGKSKNKGMAKALVDNFRDWARENGELMGFSRGEGTRRF